MRRSRVGVLLMAVTCPVLAACSAEEEVENLDYGMEWVVIPGGTFEMGCSPGDDGCHEEELPAIAVTVDSFLMLRTEVTEEQYEAVTGDKPSCDPQPQEGPNAPVECISWEDAAAFCDSLDMRLPTEAEWEFAARGGTTTRYYCGDDESCLDSIAWFADNDEGHKHVVGGKDPNQYGLHDMLGNVLEWTADCYAQDYQCAPPRAGAAEPLVGPHYVTRGGSFGLGSNALRVSRRSYHEKDATWVNIGFRCVRSN